ncbi:hypothetical protein CC79DRAFT_455989 [Sarocladium strictum]
MERGGWKAETRNMNRWRASQEKHLQRLAIRQQPLERTRMPLNCRPEQRNVHCNLEAVSARQEGGRRLFRGSCQASTDPGQTLSAPTAAPLSVRRRPLPIRRSCDSRLVIGCNPLRLARAAPVQILSLGPLWPVLRQIRSSKSEVGALVHCISQGLSWNAATTTAKCLHLDI